MKVANISLGLTWVLFVGIIFGHFAFNLDEHLLHFLKEFGLILFVYSIGLQVGPSFFSSFGKGGLPLNLLAIGIILLSIVTTLGIFYATGTPITTMAGILSGAVTNTPGLGAAQQANSDLNGIDAPEIAASYAAAYPIGVLGVISRLLRAGEQSHTDVVNGQTTFQIGDQMLITAAPHDIEAITGLLGEPCEVDWEKCDRGHISRRILITRPDVNGKTIGNLHLRTQFGANITHVYRSGVELVAAPHLRLQMGDRVTVVGTELAISHAEKRLGNSMKRLNVPNLIPIFLGIALGVAIPNVFFRRLINPRREQKLIELLMERHGGA